jgi:hypothetical protein
VPKRGAALSVWLEAGYHHRALVDELVHSVIGLAAPSVFDELAQTAADLSGPECDLLPIAD